MMIYLITIIMLFIGCANAHYQLNNEKQELAHTLAGLTDDYLTEHIGLTGFGGKAFCTYKTLDIEETEHGINEYLFVDCQEYYPNDGHLQMGTGRSLPVVLYLQKENQTYKAVGHKTPRDGSQNRHDIETLFPARTHKEIQAIIDGPNFWREELEKKAKLAIIFINPSKDNRCFGHVDSSTEIIGGRMRKFLKTNALAVVLSVMLLAPTHADIGIIPLRQLVSHVDLIVVAHIIRMEKQGEARFGAAIARVDEV